eukprot:TRINITY_DN11570_c0_g1_i1.p1 TRINITY_DN11570_c0_g1~~TRINITY_DN11570_c0_g1_i1.p1  ORF type:complete len:357 (-),score=104.27 TRINITY_DN11570_c0_g1_i1:224-1294(-)
MARDISSGVDPSMQYLSGAYKGTSAESTLSRVAGIGADALRKVQFCAECGTRLDAGGYKASKDSASVYCKLHYDALHGTKCEGCQQPISGACTEADGKKYHPQCYSQDVGCHGCRKRVFGETLEACGHLWHPACFKCTLCYDKLGAAFVEKQGLPYCKKCSAAPMATAGSSTVAAKADAETVRQKLEETKLHNADARKLAGNIEKGKMFCAECGQSLGVGEAVEVSGGMFHLVCLRCSKCNTELAATGGYKVVNGDYVCAKCAGSSTGGGFCGNCGEKLTGQYVSAMGAKWHKECFVCTTCKKPFQGGFAEKAGKPYCSGCVSQASSAQPRVVVTGQKVGFTVDPRTGEKKYTTPR